MRRPISVLRSAISSGSRTWRSGTLERCIHPVHDSQVAVCTRFWAWLLPVVAIGGVPARSHAQGAVRARSTFATVLDAADDLARIEPQPADANGELRRWDRRWRASLDRLLRRPPVRAQCIAARECAAREACELVAWMGGAAADVLHARAGMLRDPNDWLGGGPREGIAEMAHALALRRLVADEAARRRRARLSCEDLPMREQYASEWRSSDAAEPDASAGQIRRLRDAGEARLLLAFARGGLPGLEAELRRRLAQAPPPPSNVPEAPPRADAEVDESEPPDAPSRPDVQARP